MTKEEKTKIFEFFQKEFGIDYINEGEEFASTLILNLVFEFQYLCIRNAILNRNFHSGIKQRKDEQNGN